MSTLFDFQGRAIRNPGLKMCDVAGCTKAAVFRVGALLWAKGSKPRSHEPRPVASDLHCCKEHEGFPTVKNCFPAEARKQITASFLRQNVKEPDFETAEIMLVPIRK